MIFVCVLLQVSGVVLAILARMHCSKYKDMDAVKQASVLEREEILGRKRTRKMLACSIALLILSATFAELLVWKDKNDKNRDSTSISRTDYSGQVQTKDILLTFDDKEYAYSMEIFPREYTEEEFLTLAQKKIGEVKRTMLGSNEDFDHIASDLELPYEDAEGVFTYSWISDNPQVLSSFGKINKEELEHTTPVTLKLTVSYLSYKWEEDIPLKVVKEMRRESAVTETLDVLRQLETETRTEKIVTLPKEYAGVQITLKTVTDTKARNCLTAGILLAITMILLARVKLREDIKKQNDTLIEQYPSFVNMLCLMLGSGMTIQMGIRQILSGMENNVLLKKELEYAIHQIETGCEEAWVYEQLGRRLRVPEYHQLMQHLSQHIRMGTKDLRNLMEKEAQIARKKRCEFAKKKGEEASTKLLFPMVVLLATVMLLIVYPAMTGF